MTEAMQQDRNTTSKMEAFIYSDCHFIIFKLFLCPILRTQPFNKYSKKKKVISFY